MKRIIAFCLTLILCAVGFSVVTSEDTTFISNASDEPSIAKVTDIGNNRVEVDVQNASNGLTAYVASYDEAGRFLEIKSEALHGGSGSYYFDFSNAAGRSVKVFITDEKAEPKCESKRADVTMVEKEETNVKRESFGVNGGKEIRFDRLTHYDSSAASTVYFTSDISSDALVEAYKALDVPLSGKVAVKISTGESENSNHLRPTLIKELTEHVSGTIVECNTAYGGNRGTSARSLNVAESRGYTAIANFDLLDETGSMTLLVNVPGGHLSAKGNLVGSHFSNYNSYLILSHFKGHMMAGFGGAIKNTSIGIASSAGKARIHGGGADRAVWSNGYVPFLEAMGEATKSVSDYVKSNGGDIVYVSVMNRLSVDCDCDGSPATPDMHDIGILASLDPVALDQACVDLVYAVDDGSSLIERMRSRAGDYGEKTLGYAENIGLGSRSYKLRLVE